VHGEWRHLRAHADLAIEVGVDPSRIVLAENGSVIELANGTEYGLAARVWTQDLARAHALASSIEAGTVWVNCNVVLDESQPFAGWKQSGLGIEGGRSGVEEYVQPRAVVIAT
jgi:aldehyde dehydrogenase (NAD+)